MKAPFDDLPPEFDLRFYRNCNPDLLQFEDSELEFHFQRHGRAEGRRCSVIDSRVAFFALLKSVPSILEIGPLASPSVRGNNVRYFDVLPTEALREKARANAMNPDKCPHIDYVSPTGDLAVVDATFDAVVSSHAVEHQPDLIRHLEHVAHLLNPGGRYYLAVPDKRFCFDYFIAESNIAEVLDAHLRAPRVHAAGNVIEHMALTTHNDPVLHWRGEHGAPVWQAKPHKLRDAVTAFLCSHGGYLDSHAWQFTPASFRELMQGLAAIELSPFELLRSYGPVWGSNEFYAVLEKHRDNNLSLAPKLPAEFDGALYLLANPDVAAAGMDPVQHYLKYGRDERRKLRPAT